MEELPRFAFGPCALATEPGLPPLHLVLGRRSSQLRSEVRRLCPRKPGVYGMLDRQEELIYLGKAKNLRARLLSYFRRRSRDPKAGKILGQTGTIAWEVSPDEFAALHRELELIRRWRPRFNVLGQPRRRRFTHVCLGRSPAPYVFLSSRPPARVLARFGPIPLGQRAREAVRRLNDCFRLRDCPQAQEMVFPDQADLFPDAGRTPGCLRFEIGTCLGPCVAGCSAAAYGDQVAAARAFLAGSDLSLLHHLEQEMNVAAAAQHFERAAGLRDKLVSLRWLHEKLGYVRRCRASFSFIYPVTGHQRQETWYLIHDGRTVAALPGPSRPEDLPTAQAFIKKIYQENKASCLLESYEHYDSLLLVASWFRRRPRERLRTLKPDLDLLVK